jgi:uncharacterized alkaline shock family protein YloU
VKKAAKKQAKPPQGVRRCSGCAVMAGELEIAMRVLKEIAASESARTWGTPERKAFDAIAEILLEREMARDPLHLREALEEVRGRVDHEVTEFNQKIADHAFVRERAVMAE